jgi:hypothetical protein
MAGSNGDLSEAEVLAMAQQLSPEAKTTLLIQLLEELGGTEEEEEVLFEEDDLWWEDEDWDEEDLFVGYLPVLDRRHLLAAEVYGYSYVHYAARVEVNARFEEYMPGQIDTLEDAEEEGWDDAELARALDLEEDEATAMRSAFQEAKAIVDAPTPAESFRRGVWFSILHAVEEGLADEGAIEELVDQICYRAVDLAYLLDIGGELLSEYIEDLQQSDYDTDWQDELLDED